MKKIFLIFASLIFLANNVMADWDKSLPAGTTLINDIDSVVTANNTALDRGLASFCDIGLIYSSASTITAGTGSCVVSNSAGSVRVYLNNSSTTSVSFTDIDTGAEASATTYYVYAMAAATSSTTATFKVSASSSAPSGVTYYAKIGSFYNNSSSDIDQNKIYAAPYRAPFTDSSGIDLGRFLAIYDYGTSASSSTRRNPSTYFIAHGITTDGTAVSNLPFSSSTSWALTCLMTSGVITQNVSITSKSASGFTCSDGLGNGNSIDWIAFGY